MKKGHRSTFGMDFGLGEGIAHHNRTFRWCKSLNIHFHHLSIATMLAPNQPYSHSEFTSPTGLAGWQNFKLRNNKALLLYLLFHFCTILLLTVWCNTRLEPPRINGIPQHQLGLTMHMGLVRTLFIYPGSQLCIYHQYILMPCWNC